MELINNKTKEQITATDNSNIQLLKEFGFVEGKNKDYTKKSFLRTFWDLPNVAKDAFIHNHRVDTYEKPIRHRKFADLKKNDSDFSEDIANGIRSANNLTNCPDGWVADSTAKAAEIAADEATTLTPLWLAVRKYCLKTNFAIIALLLLLSHLAAVQTFVAA